MLSDLLLDEEESRRWHHEIGGALLSDLSLDEDDLDLAWGCRDELKTMVESQQKETIAVGVSGGFGEILADD